MKIKYRLIYLIVTSCLLLGYKNINDSLDNIISCLEQYFIQNPQEKIYVQIDKTIYAAGDSIWLKSYVVNADGNHLSDLSKVLYINLVDENDSVSQRLKIPLDAGLGWGKILIPDTIKSGIYRVEAYTNWMRNFDQDYFFNKTFYIGNALEGPVNSSISLKAQNIYGKRNLTAQLSFQKDSASPLVNSPVKWHIWLNDRVLANGNGITSTDGTIDIKIPQISNNTDNVIVEANFVLTNGQRVTKKFPLNMTGNNPDIQFFPEGGNLLCNIRSKIAFKAISAQGTSIEVAGTVIDDLGGKVADFKSEHAGMGYFTLTPHEGRKYMASVVFPDHSQKNYPLPFAGKNGYSLSVINDSTDKIKIAIGNSLTAGENGEIKIVAQMNGVVKYASKSTIVPDILNAEIPKSRFGTGIVHFTLFSTQNIPVAERMIFIKQRDDLNIIVKTNKESYQKGEKVDLSMDIKDAEGNPMKGAFSIAVTNDSKIHSNELDERNIFTELLLTSDLKGYIEQPNYYFTDVNYIKIRHLDLLMMTQGWSRFVWEDMLSGKLPVKAYTPEHGLEISGKVTGASGHGIEGAKVSLNMMPGSKPLGDTVTSAEGKFRFTDLLFADTGKFLLVATDKKGNNTVDIKIDNEQPSENKSKGLWALVYNSRAYTAQGITDYLKNSKAQFDYRTQTGFFKRTIELKEVSIRERKLTKIEEALRNSDNFNGPGNADKVITYMDLRNYHDLSSALQGKIAGVVIRGGSGHYDAFARGYGAPMLIVVDGVPSQIHIDQIDVQSVQSIEVLKSAGYLAVYGIKGSGGVLVVTTKRGGINYDPTPDLPKGFLYYHMMGYTLAKKFYSPAYPTVDGNRIRDFRTTLYWNPDVVTDKDGRAELSFYNADVDGKYRVVIEGITPTGKLGHWTRIYAVN